MLYRNMVMKMLKCKQFFLMTSHFGTTRVLILFLCLRFCAIRRLRAKFILPPSLLVTVHFHGLKSVSDSEWFGRSSTNCSTSNIENQHL